MHSREAASHPAGYGTCPWWPQTLLTSRGTDLEVSRRSLFSFEELSFSYKKIMQNKNYIRRVTHSRKGGDINLFGQMMVTQRSEQRGHDTGQCRGILAGMRWREPDDSMDCPTGILRIKLPQSVKREPQRGPKITVHKGRTEGGNELAHQIPQPRNKERVF